MSTWNAVRCVTVIASLLGFPAASCTSNDSGAGGYLGGAGYPPNGTSGAGAGSPGGAPSSAGASPGGAFGSGGGSALGSGGTTGTAGSGGRDPLDASAGDTDAGDGEVGDGGMIIGAPIPPPVPVGCVTDVTPGVHTFDCDTTIDVVSVPAQCTKTACGVIVDVHGGMMSSQMEDKNTNLRELGRQHGYIVIQPNALQNALLLNQRLFVTGTDDTRVMDILTQVMNAFHVDRNRIHMTGFSEGGYMSWRWYCQHSDLLASVAPGAAAWNCANLAALGLTPPEVGCPFIGGDGGTSRPAHNIPALYMQGTKDGLVDPKCADTWFKSNVLPTLQEDTGRQIAGDSTFTRTRYLDPDGVPLEYIQHQYTTDSAFLGVAIVGHCYPGSTDLVVTPPAQTVVQPDQLMSFGCKDQCSFCWGEEVIKFFMAHPKRR